MKLFRKIRKTQSNKGFSLIEVLVTIMIIAIVSIPLVRSFVVNANVNHKARRLQNATDLAQNVSEYFAARPMDELLDGNAVSVNPEGDMYVFKNIKNLQDGSDYFVGAEGEKFYVTVVMDNKGFEGYSVPELKNLFGSGGVTCLKEIYMYDNAAVNKFITKDGAPAGSTAQSLGLKKETDIYIDTNSDGSYKYSLNVTYHYNDKKYETGEIKLEEVKTGSKDVATERFPNLYVMYQPYAVYEDGNYTGKVSDIVNIRYSNSDNNNSLNANVFFVQQNAYFQNDESKGIEKLDTDNTSKFRIYYNNDIAKYDTLPDSERHLTVYKEGDTNITNGSGAVGLCAVKVYITYGEPDSTSDSEYFSRPDITGGAMVSVGTIREEKKS